MDPLNLKRTQRERDKLVDPPEQGASAPPPNNSMFFKPGAPLTPAEKLRRQKQLADLLRARDSDVGQNRP